MSQETLEWLNSHTLIGMTEKYGHAWHFDGESDNQYPGAVPIEDVRSRLFDWEATETPVVALLPNRQQVKDESRKAIVRADGDHRVLLGIHKTTYKVHQYQDWLLDTVGLILDDDLVIGSAGMLKNYAVAWVQVEVPDSVETPEGVVFRPHILCKTSHDGTLATTYGRAITNVVCDNTMAVASGEHGGQRIRIRHTANSEARLKDARDALGIVHQMSAEFAQSVADLCATTVTDAEFDRFLESLFPTKGLEDGRGKTMAVDKHQTLRSLWNSDERVEPWKGTAFGAWQAYNTAVQHEFSVRGSREGRNLTNAVYGFDAKSDAKALEVLEAVLA